MLQKDKPCKRLEFNKSVKDNSDEIRRGKEPAFVGFIVDYQVKEMRFILQHKIPLKVLKIKKSITSPKIATHRSSLYRRRA